MFKSVLGKGKSLAEVIPEKKKESKEIKEFKWKVDLDLEVVSPFRVDSKMDLIGIMQIILDQYTGTYNFKEAIYLLYAMAGVLAEENQIEAGYYEYKCEIRKRLFVKMIGLSDPLTSFINYSTIMTSQYKNKDVSVNFRIKCEPTNMTCSFIKDFYVMYKDKQNSKTTLKKTYEILGYTIKADNSDWVLTCH